MTQISVVPAAGGERIQLGPVQMRILEDGRTTGHRLGVGEYFRDLRDMIAAGQPMTPDNIGPVMSRYATVPAADYAQETR